MNTFLDSAIFLAAAVIAVPIFKRLGLGTVLGYLAAGAAIGPSGLGLIHRVEETFHVAELGVVLLLFIIGLELQPARLWRMRGLVFGLGGAQVILTAAIFTACARAFGLSWTAAALTGFALAMSSTAFVIQILTEKNELGSTHGRAAFGALLFQDLAAIPLLAMIPLLGAEHELTPAARTPENLVLRVIITIAAIAGIMLGGRYLLRPFFRFIASARSHEVSAAWALFVVLGTAVAAGSVGLSMGLGAFVAGVLLASSEYRHELEANIEPFKGLLLGLFFMTVGMAANVRLVLEKPLVVLTLVLALVVLKLAVVYVLGRRWRYPNDTALSLGIALAQGGEFAFVIFSMASQGQLLERTHVELLSVVVTLSMGVTPLLFLAREKVAAHRGSSEPSRAFDEILDDGSRVIVAGFGRFGQIVARILRHKRIPFTALDASPEHVDFVRRFGSRIYYGDASRVELLRAARADRAELFVLAIDDIEASLRTARAVQEHFPHLEIIARARNRQHAYALLALGIKIVIRETFAASLEAASHALQALGMSEAEAATAARMFRAYDEEMLLKQFVFREDEKALIAFSKQYTKELEQLFERDAARRHDSFEPGAIQPNE